MPEKTKQAETDANCDAENQINEAEKNDTGNWSDDQQKKGYYYDDAYGYEVYDPNADDEDEAKDFD